MKTKQLLAVLATVVQLAGCSKAVNVNPDPNRNYSSDSYECERDARLTFDAKQTKPTPGEVENLKDRCMKSRGWRSEYQNR